MEFTEGRTRVVVRNAGECEARVRDRGYSRGSGTVTCLHEGFRGDAGTTGIEVRISCAYQYG